MKECKTFKSLKKTILPNGGGGVTRFLRKDKGVEELNGNYPS